MRCSYLANPGTGVALLDLWHFHAIYIVCNHTFSSYFYLLFLNCFVIPSFFISPRIARHFSIHTMKLVGASFLSHFRLRQEFIHFSSEESQLPDERRTDAAVARIGKKKDGLHTAQLLVDVSLLTLILEILGASYASH